MLEDSLFQSACHWDHSCLLYLILAINKGYFRAMSFFLVIQMIPSEAECHPAAFQSILFLQE